MTRTIQSAAETRIPADAAAPQSDTGRQSILRDLAARTAAFVVLAAASTTLMALPYLGDGHAAEDRADHAARVAQAFQVTDGVSVRPELIDAVSAFARKSDKLSAATPCGAQTWPHIARGCLAGGEAHTASKPVRSVTVEYQLGANSSALVRTPVQQLAAQ